MTNADARISWARRALLASLLTMTAGLPVAARAADAAWPTKPIRLVVPFPPGGSGDSIARLVGQSIAQRVGQPVVIDNRPGANLFIGAQELVHAAPDGYTFLLALDTILTVNPFVFSKIPYDPKDFAPVSLVTTQSMWFVTRPNSKVASMTDLVAKAKAQPNSINYGSGALIGQLTGELFKSLTGASMTYIPYKGSAPAAQALMSGELDLVVSDITPLVPFIKDGKLIVLGQTGKGRSAVLPDAPSMIEQGLKDFEVTGWFGIYAPVGTPAAIVSRMNAELVSVMSTPDVKAKVTSYGLDATSSTPAELSARSKDDADKWEKVIRAANIRLD